jgi:general secretion pathway protein C
MPMQWIRSFFSTSGPLSWPVRIVSSALFLAALALAAYWVMVLTTPKPALAPVAVRQGVLGEAGAAQAVNLFGMGQSPGAGPAPATTSSSTIKVQGIISAGARGAAILSIEGKPGRFVAVGNTLAPESPTTRLVQVKPESVVLDVGGRSEELPAPARANTQILTSGVGKPRGLSDPAALGSPAPSAPNLSAPPPIPQSVPAPAMTPPAPGQGPQPEGGQPAAPALSPRVFLQPWLT